MSFSAIGMNPPGLARVAPAPTQAERPEEEPEPGPAGPLAENEHEHAERERARRKHRGQCGQPEFEVAGGHACVTSAGRGSGAAGRRTRGRVLAPVWILMPKLR